jgi:hypothetical protein
VSYIRICIKIYTRKGKARNLNISWNYNPTGRIGGRAKKRWKDNFEEAGKEIS